MSRVRVKICGLTRAGDVRDAVSAGADMLGFVFARSPRQLGSDQARALLAEVPTGVDRVGLFMDQPASVVRAIVEQLSLDLLQFHGGEDNEFCADFGLPFVKALPMGVSGEIDWTAYPQARALLLDSHRPGEPGGTGRRFNWSLARPVGRDIWLAGGLGCENVSAAIKALRPQAVDVSSGVERSPGIKDRQLMFDFVAAVRAADSA